MKRTIITIVSAIVVAVGGFFAWKGCSRGASEINLDNYTPNEEFAPAFEALNEAKSAEAYDIEETVKILNGLEVAQSQAKDFDAFIEYMAKQDYSRVPQDVIDAKKELLPILQKMFELQKQYEKLDGMWLLARSATTGVSNFAENANPIAVLGSIFTGDPLESVSVGKSFKDAKTAAFEQYEQDKRLKASLKEEIANVREAYVEYLNDYAPVYFKYMNEWDKLCLARDKAYLDIYSGRTKDAYNAVETVLDKYPANREAMLLKALSLIQLSGNNVASKGEIAVAPTTSTVESDSIAPEPQDEFLNQANAVLNNYMELYPDRSAPALVLKGMISLKEGNESAALSSFDQASVEYPRQAAALTDLLDSYKHRSYLNKTSEGKYLLKLYKSTMEGYGMFSPNLLKAKYYADQGMLDQSKEEIFNHFYRRGNQGVYDCLLSDMQYCEENMYSIFKQLLMEQSYIDVAVEPTTDWKLSDKDDEVKVTINNRSDIDLENVRIFLCLHYTDMYKDEYDIVKCPTINIIKHHDQTEIGVVKLNYEDKKYDDITRIRAIAMTDDKICWIDDVDYKYIHAYEAAKQSAKAKKQSLSRREQFLKDFNVDGQSLLEAVKTGIKVAGEVKKGEKTFWDSVSDIWSGSDDKNLKIELPRILSLIDPVFSLNELKDKDKAIMPKENFLTGTGIRLKFDYEPKNGDTVPLYIYSDYVSFKVTITFKDNKPKVEKIETL
ncbi:MAG: hypothetical protein MJY95_03895 [Bacteroidaceae bacterium]|nr:hypothetical protein [Bacteroidaceae bacterium]